MYLKIILFYTNAGHGHHPYGYDHGLAQSYFTGEYGKILKSFNVIFARFLSLHVKLVSAGGFGHVGSAHVSYGTEINHGHSHHHHHAHSYHG